VYQKHLNGDPVNSLVMLATFIMILLFNSSCVYVPLPAHDLTSPKGVINDELIESLKPGETTREDLLLLLGAPDTQYEQDRYFIYEWEATEGAFVVAGGGGDFIVNAHYFCVEFDEDNRIKRFGHFNSEIDKKLWMHEAKTGLFGYGPIDKLPAIVDEKRFGEVTVIRIRHPFMFAMKYIISLNGTEIFVIRSGQHTKFKLNEGEHYIGVKCFGGWSPGWKHEFLDFSVTPNSSSFVKVAPNFPCAGIESITEEEALIKIENSKYVPMNKQ
jgi:outer membrane protein assembly factor BamE (lipoprotein component of BamABCDE complex)